MANVLLTENGQLKYLQSVNTADYVIDPSVTKDKVKPKAGVLINPDISAVKDLDLKYWKINGTKVEAMTTAEKKAIDDAEKAKIESEKKIFNISTKDLAEALINLGVITRQDLEQEVIK